MALFSASSSGKRELGKFHQRRRPGVQQDSHQSCGDYRLELLSMETSTPIKRTRYHVRIFNARNLRVAFLRDFSSSKSAIKAGQGWVAERELSKQS